jgi:hypothetical protein
MNDNQFLGVLALIPPKRGRLRRMLNFPTFKLYHDKWLEYFNCIYFPKCNNSLRWRVIICESCPETANNYIFSNLNLPLNKVSDSYLWSIFAGVFTGAIPAGLTKGIALERLAEENILIMDILPTHGIKISTDERKEFCSVGIQNFGFHHSIINDPPYHTHELHYLFAVPPSLVSCGFPDIWPGNPYRNPFEGGININIGQGHVPNKNELISAIERGF